MKKWLQQAEQINYEPNQNINTQSTAILNELHSRHLTKNSFTKKFVSKHPEPYDMQ